MQELSSTKDANSLLRRRFLGEAWLDESNTLIMRLWSSTDWSPLKATVSYAPEDKAYLDIVAHLGGIIQGETKLVPNWR